MEADLIYDIGCNNGDDTDFYLRKGFRVLALDADSSLCRDAIRRFPDEGADGRLKVVNGLISDVKSETAPFYLFEACSGWNTANPGFKALVESAGHAAIKVDVPVVHIGDLLRQYGVPYYMKIDIEGHDLLALKGLESFLEHHNDKPAYVSTEFDRHDLHVGLAHF